MNSQDVPIAQLKSWLKDVKRISHELRCLPVEEEPTFYKKDAENPVILIQG